MLLRAGQENFAIHFNKCWNLKRTVHPVMSGTCKRNACATQSSVPNGTVSLK